MGKSASLTGQRSGEALNGGALGGGARPFSPAFMPSLGRVVKEEISDDNARLPCFNGRVVSWVSAPSLLCPRLR